LFFLLLLSILRAKGIEPDPVQKGMERP